MIRASTVLAATLTMTLGVSASPAEVSVTIGSGEMPEQREQIGAMHFFGGDDLRIAAEEVIEGDLYVGFCNSLRVRGLIQGDLSALGSEIHVPGRVDDDVSIGALNSEIDGWIGDTLRAAVVNLIVRGEVNGNVVVAAGELLFEPSSRIGGALVGRGGNVELAGRYDGPVQIGAGVAKVSGTFADDVEITCDELEIAPEARIEGNLTYKARNDVQIPEGVVSGVIKRLTWTEEVQTDESFFDFGEVPPVFKTLFRIYLAVIAIVAGMILILFFRPFVDGALDQASGGSNLVMAFGTGLVALLVGLFIGVACALFFPLSIAIWAALVALSYVGLLVGKIILGRLILAPISKGAPHPLVALLIGVTVSAFVELIPIVGDIVWLLLMVTGAGACLLQLRVAREQPAGPAAPQESPRTPPPVPA